jgi:putative DNA primase/helicase
MRLFIRRLLGLSLDVKVTAHILPIFYGDGANGKSTLTDAVMGALGDYADAADPDLLRARSFDAHPTGVADLFGLRLALIHEGDAGHRLAEGTVKRLTGGDRLKARRMREDFWSFDPSHTFVMLTNHKPLVGGTDEGIWRRLRLVPFEVIIPGSERDERLGEKLTAEVGAVLAWLVAGYLDWRENGLAEPGKVTEAYRAESDALGRFLHERCLVMPALHAGSSEMFSTYEKWCAAEREDPWHAEGFRRRDEGQEVREPQVQRADAVGRRRSRRQGRCRGGWGGLMPILARTYGTNLENVPTLPKLPPEAVHS